jgi:hypothetical protein
MKKTTDRAKDVALEFIRAPLKMLLVLAIIALIICLI